MKKILFVCTGNTCRSSMAEGIFNYEISKPINKTLEYISSSAGTGAYEGEPVSKNSVLVLKNSWDINIEKHLARRVNETLVLESFLILTMTTSHKNMLNSIYPNILDKVFTLKEYNMKKQITSDEFFSNFTLKSCDIDIKDPFGLSVDVYNECANEIYTEIKKLIELLGKL